MSFFHPFTDVILKEDSPKAVHDLFSGRYNVRKVEKGRGDDYRVYTRDGHVIKVGVGEKTNIFGEQRSFIKYVDE